MEASLEIPDQQEKEYTAELGAAPAQHAGLQQQPVAMARSDDAPGHTILSLTLDFQREDYRRIPKH